LFPNRNGFVVLLFLFKMFSQVDSELFPGHGRGSFN